MVKLDFDGHIVYSREDGDAQRRKDLARALISSDSTQAESQTSFPSIRPDDNTEINNQEINSISTFSYERDQYGNEIKYDSDGNIQEIIVSPIKYD